MTTLNFWKRKLFDWSTTFYRITTRTRKKGNEREKTGYWLLVFNVA